MASKKHIVLICGIMLLPFFPEAQPATRPVQPVQEDSILSRIILIGDAGQLTNGKHPVVNAVRNHIKLDKKTTVLYLGDNLYKTGLPDSQAISYKQMKAVLDSQLSVVEGTQAKLYMIPGNHDWKNGGAEGLDAVMREQLYVNFLNKPNIQFLPEDGCPGPRLIELGSDVVVIAFDSQWWLHPHEKPEIESDCACKTTDELVNQIEEMATKNSKKLVILASHHPFKSNGTHGGYYTFKQHLFPLTDLRKNLYIPLPLIGSIYPISRSVFGTPQDLKHPVYQNMIQRISEKLKPIPNLVFAAGHDHNLQHIIDSNRNYIVSGGGCKINRSSKARNSRYNSPSMGFAVMEVSKNKNVTLDFYEVTDTSAHKDYSAFLLNFSKIPNEAPDNNTVQVEDPFIKYKDSFRIAASKDLQPIWGLKKLFMGGNYRKEWSTPVNMQVFNLNKEGFTISGLGGGTQTKALRLIDKNNKEWVLRNIKKDPMRAIPEAFRVNLAQNLSAELSSAAHPYGAMTFPVLAEALDINVARPRLVFVPDDPALGFHRPLFRNTVCMLEEKDASWDGSSTRSTAKVIDKMLDENDHRTATGMVLQSRLLDMMTADFDRHLDQWRWGSMDTGKGKVYYPIPRDRDQAYFNSDGLVLRFFSNRSMPFLKGYRYTIPKVNWLNYNARDFDRIFLTDLDESAWKVKIEDFKSRMSDSVIKNALRQLPPEIFAIAGNSMITKMISRRNELEQAALHYYKFLAKKVNVMGSNQKEYFKLSNAPGGLQVRVYARARGNDTSFIMFDRVFKSTETREIHLYGLNDDDRFDIEDHTHSPIKIRIIGGRGNDTFDLRGNVENLLYDFKNIENNFIVNNRRTKNRFSDNPPVNERSIMGYNYNTTRFPRIHINYNSDDRLVAGIGYSRRTYGFRNLPYASDQNFSLLYAPDHKAWQADYKGVFNHITRDYDLLVHGNISQPALKNFTGFGNGMKPEQGKEFSYYLTRYRSVDIGVYLRKRFFENVHFVIGPNYFNYRNSYEDNLNTVLGKWKTLRLDSSDIFSSKNYAGIKMAFLIDNRNKEHFPTRGVHWKTELTGLKGITKGSDNYIKYTTDMVVYASLSEPAKLVAVLKWGGGRIYSKNFEFFQSLSLGANNDLNGFRKNVYNGRGLLYGSIELKLKLFEVNSFILPGPFGISAFIDGGRVWMKNEKVSTWHSAYGAGVYYLPFNMLSISASAGFSGGNRMVIFNLGTKFNLIW